MLKMSNGCVMVCDIPTGALARLNAFLEQYHNHINVSRKVIMVSRIQYGMSEVLLSVFGLSLAMLLLIPQLFILTLHISINFPHHVQLMHF